MPTERDGSSERAHAKAPVIHGRMARLDTFEVPSIDKTLEHAQPVDAITLGNILGVSDQTLWGLIRNAHRLYHTVEIPKKSGGIRTLHIPAPTLSWAQSQILDRFLNRVAYPEHVSAYVPGRSALDAARKHAGKPVLIVVDIKDFFPSTPRLWVQDAFVAQMRQTPYVAALLATLVTAPAVPGVNARFRVPQGAPTSGAVANLVAMDRIDPRMLEISRRRGLAYTRYADDLAFSSSTPVGHAETSEIVREILHALKASGYRPNYDKVRVQRPNTQQRLLGMCINVRPNLPCSTYRKVRALVHNTATNGADYTAAAYGYESAEQLESYLQGMLAYSSPLAPQRAARLRAELGW